MIDRGDLFLAFWLVLFSGALAFALVGIAIAF